jgi:hypothetical protein
MPVPIKKLLRDTDWKNNQIVRGTADLDKELVDELRRNLKEQPPNIGHGMFTWVVVCPDPVTESNLRYIGELEFLIREFVGN